MANEANNAEEQLRRYAEERRQNAPREIHAATRNLLQGEVRRTYGNPEQRHARFRWRWVQAVAWIAIVAAIPIFLIPRNPPAKGKLQEMTPTAENEVKLPAANMPGEAPIVMSDTKQPVKPPLTELAHRKDSAADTAAPVALRDETKREAASRAMEMPRLRALPEPAKKENELAITSAKAVAPAASTMAGSPASAAAAPTGINNLTLNFANTVPNQPVLNNFKFEQTGARLKFSEKDGSVYAGRLLSQQSGTDAFQVAGMNRTLNKATIITGQVVRATLANVANVAQQQAASGAQNTDLNNSVANNSSAINNAAANNSYFNNTDNVRVQGAAQIGNRQYKLDAQPTPGP